jgi:hypothetical protein
VGGQQDDAIGGREIQRIEVVGIPLPLIASDVHGLPTIPKWNRRAQQRFSELVDTMAEGDSTRAREIWA